MLFHFTTGPTKTINWQMCLVSEIECNYFEVHAYSSMGKGRLTHIRSPSPSPPCCGEKGPPLALQDTLHLPSGSRTTVLYHTPHLLDVAAGTLLDSAEKTLQTDEI